MKAKLQVVGAMLVIAIAMAACSSNNSANGTSTTSTTAASSATTSATTSPPTTAAASTTTTAAAQSITITPDTGLTNNETVLITGTGYKPSEQLGVTECQNDGNQTGAGDCDLGSIKIINANAQGDVSASVPVALGPFGQDNIVCTKTPYCLLSVAQAGVASPAQVATELLHFG